MCAYNEDRIEKTINDELIIDDLEAVERSLNITSGKINIEDIIHYVNTQKETVWYLNKKLELLGEERKSEAMFVWIDSGIVNREGARMYFSMLRFDENSPFAGHIISDLKYLCKILIDKNPKYAKDIKVNFSKLSPLLKKAAEERDVPELEYDQSSSASYDIEEPEEPAVSPVKINYDSGDKSIYKIFEDIFNGLMYSCWKSINGLDRYIKVIGTRLQQLVADKKSEYYVHNNKGNYAVNTGLIDAFGNDYILLYQRYYREGSYDYYKPSRILSSKYDYLEEGFTKEQASVKILPVTFFNDGEDFLKLSMDEIDMTPRNINHIVEERRDRFPEHLRNIPSSVIVQRIMDSLERSVDMLKRDRTYAKPVYSAKIREISWLLPLYIERNLTEEPEMVIFLHKIGEFYQVKTVMENNDDVKDRITALNLYGKVW